MTDRQLTIIGIIATIIVASLVIELADSKLSFAEIMSSVGFVAGMGLMWVLIRESRK